MAMCRSGRLLLCVFSCAVLQFVSAADRQIVGTGASFPFVVYDKWMQKLGLVLDDPRDRTSPGVRYTYMSTGSGAGKTAVLTGTTNYSGTDSQFSSAQLASAPRMWLIPSLAGAVSIGYNVPDSLGFKDADVNTTALKIPRHVLPAIFLGTITKWSDLATWNPSLANVTANITLVVRSDSSGTTSAFTNALNSFAPTAWIKNYTGDLPKWPGKVIKGEGNPGRVRVRMRPLHISVLQRFIYRLGL